VLSGRKTGKNELERMRKEKLEYDLRHWKETTKPSVSIHTAKK
jgi:hypothetical protein